MITDLCKLFKVTVSVFRNSLYLLPTFLFYNSAWAQYNYGTGAEGAYTAPAGSSTLSGTHNYTSFTIPSGDTVVAIGDVPLIIRCEGNVTINGVLTAAGSPGVVGLTFNTTTQQAPGGAGGTGGGGGWGAAGGTGGNAEIGLSSGVYGNNGGQFYSFTGAGYGGHWYGTGGVISAGTGGSYGTLGQIAPATVAPSAGNSTIGSIYGDNMLATTVNTGTFTTDLLGGSGGGGGGGRNQSVNNGALWGGCGGGGGGGAIQITAYNITLGTNGLVSVRGGNGGSDPNHGVGAGGGGSGGTILLQYAQALTGASLNTTAVFLAGSTIDIAGGDSGKAAYVSSSYYYTVGGAGGQGRYLAQQDPNPPNSCSAPALIPEANGNGTPATVCSGTIALTSNPTGGSGCTGTYQYGWSNGAMYWNGTGFLSSSAVYNAAYDSISATLSGNGSFTVYSRCSADTTCINSEAITVNVSANVTPTISISTPQTTICEGTIVMCNATATNKGSSPVYQWIKNGKNAGTGTATYSDSTVNNNDTIYCILTSNATCLATSTATSNMMVMTVNPTFIPTISIQTVQTVICQGQPANFTSSTNSNSSIYQWEVNSVPVGSSSAYDDTNVANNDTVICILTSSDACANPTTIASSPIIMAVTALPSSGTISADADTVCTGSNAHLILTGSTGSIDWQSSATAGNFTDAGANGANYYPGIQQTTYYRVITSSGSCSDTSAIFLLTAAPVPLLSFVDTVRGSTVNFNASASTYTNIYNWTFGDGTSSDSINPIHTFANADTDADYFVCLNGTNTSNCSSQICQTVSITGLPTDVSDFTAPDLYTVYPSPFMAYLIINTASTSYKTEEIDIYNLIGQRVYNRHFDELVMGSLHLDMPALAVGIYFLRIKTAGMEQDFIQPIMRQ